VGWTPPSRGLIIPPAVNELRVPTHATSAEIRCADGRVLVGRVFIPVSSSHHSGPMRPEEWMNEPAQFFAFLPDDAKATVLLSKPQVAVLTIPAAEAEDAPDEDVELPVRRLAVELGDRHLEGDVVIDMPMGHRRVLDYLNRPEPFLTLRAGERWHLVRKSLMTRVAEIQED
jgi:hypothetical protein